MADFTVILTLHSDTLELDLDCPELPLDVVISLLQRAMRACENQEKIVMAGHLAQASREASASVDRTHKVLSRIKLQ